MSDQQAELSRLAGLAEQMGRVLGVTFTLNPDKVRRWLAVPPPPAPEGNGDGIR